MSRSDDPIPTGAVEISHASRSSGSFPTSGSRRFGKYQLLAELGRGGMATVYLAVAHSGIQDVRRPVVVKLLDDALRSDAEFVKMFARESKIAIELSHPNIVLTHTVGQEQGRYYIAMEYLEGVTLREIMKYCGEWPLQDRLPLFGAMCLMLTGLAYVHDFQDHRGEHLGLVHRDIKPDNIFITTSGQVKLLDFGVAKAATIGFEATLGTAVRGTVQYLPPEAAKADEVVDARSDLFSAAVVLAELATGRRYWDGVPYPQILARLADDDLPSLVTAGSEDVPPQLARLLERALHPEPAARFQTASELRRAVQSVLARQGYRVNSDDLARIVTHLYEPIRGAREELVRVGLEELDRTRSHTTGTWSLAGASVPGQHVPTPSERNLDDTPASTKDELEPTVSFAPSQRPRWQLPAAAAMLLLLGGIVWIAWPRGDEPTASPRVGDAPQQPAASPPTSPDVSKAREPNPPVNAEAEAEAKTPPPSVVEPTDAAPATPASLDEQAPDSSTTGRGKSRSKSRAKKGKSSESAEPTPSAATQPAPSKPTGSKVDIEPSPYTR
jgi:serine/threonine protein kinase